MKNGVLGMLTKLSRVKNAVQFQFLTGHVSRCKAVPANGKRWKKGEHPEYADITYQATYEDMLEFMRGKNSDKIALIVWVPREEFTALCEQKGDIK